MVRFRIPEGDDWRDHAEPCPNCKQPVLKETEHYVNETMIDPGWWDCDYVEDEPGQDQGALP